MFFEEYLYDLAWILVAGVIFVLLASRIRMPSIVAFILAGLFLGPLTGLLAMTDSLELISEVGIALLLFLVAKGVSRKRGQQKGSVLGYRYNGLSGQERLGFPDSRAAGFGGQPDGF